SSSASRLMRVVVVMKFVGPFLSSVCALWSMTVSSLRRPSEIRVRITYASRSLSDIAAASYRTSVRCAYSSGPPSGVEQVARRHEGARADRILRDERERVLEHLILPRRRLGLENTTARLILLVGDLHCLADQVQQLHGAILTDQAP